MGVTRASAALSADDSAFRKFPRSLDGLAFVRIRIFRIMGFSGFYDLVFNQQALVLTGFPIMAKSAICAKVKS